jgi:hypothetical protein
MPKERVLVTVKTYPTLSRKYGEMVCTAGIRADGSWVRLYPVPFRRLEEEDRYAKFDWIEAELVKSPTDRRPETYRLVDPKDMSCVGHIGTDKNWRERRQLLLKASNVYDRLQPLLDGAKANTISLAVFKPARILDFIWEECERDWDTAKVAAMRQAASQGNLFEDEGWRETFQLRRKLPYNFSYRFSDADGRESELQVLDWEAGELYWNCLKATSNSESDALEKVRQKYLNEFSGRDIHFFLGTMQQFHGFAPNPWVIIGVFPIPHENQMDLL